MTNSADIIATGLFDTDYYVTAYPDVLAAGTEPVDHYARFGEREGRAPNAYFDPVLYRAKVGPVDSLSPLLHYARVGEAADLAPGRYFNPAWYRHAYELPRAVSALADFLRNRSLLQRLPDVQFYLLLHSRPKPLHGHPHDCFAQIISELEAGYAVPTAREVIARSGLFDANHYLINGADVHEASLDPIEHFCAHGWQEGRQPNIYFDTSWYVDINRDVKRYVVNPLMHYILEGERRGRRPIIYFDPAYYRKKYGVPEDILALAHYLSNRRSQQYSPNREFDLKWYLRTYGKQVGPNRDPFAHFLQAGTYQDLRPAADFDTSAFRQSRLGRRSRHFGWLLHPAGDNSLIRHMHDSYS